MLSREFGLEIAYTTRILGCTYDVPDGADVVKDAVEPDDPGTADVALDPPVLPTDDRVALAFKQLLSAIDTSQHRQIHRRMHFETKTDDWC